MIDSSAASPNGSKTLDRAILVVDAQEIIWGIKLNNHFKKVSEVPDGIKGYEKFIKNFGTCAGIISNWEAKELSGIELLRKVRHADNDFYDVPFIMLISEGAKREHLHKVCWAKEEGVTDFIVRPYTINSIDKKVEQMKTDVINNAEARGTLRLAEKLIGNNQLADAAAVIDKCCALDTAPLFEHAILYYRGRILEANGKNDEAVVKFTEAIDKSRFRLYAKARASLIDLHIRLNEIETALEHVSVAEKTSPLNPRWRLMRGKTLLASDKYQEAEDIFDALVASDFSYQKEVDSIYTQLGKSADSTENNEELAKVIEAAKAFREQGIFSEAIRSYYQAVSIDQRNKKKYFAMMGVINYRWHQENKDKGGGGDSKPLVDAIGFLLDAVRMDPSYKEAVKFMEKIISSERAAIEKAIDYKDIMEAERFIKQHSRY